MYDRLECLMRIFEHELIHLEMNVFGCIIKEHPIYKPHGIL